MPVRVKLKTNVAFRSSASGEVALASSVISIGDLLRHIGDDIGFDFIDAHRENLKENVEVIINDKDFWFYPTGLNTRLKDGDSIVVYLIALGGG